MEAVDQAPKFDPHADVPIPTQKTFHICDSNYGPRQERLAIQYNPQVYSTPEKAAKAFYEALKPVVIAYGQQPESELFLQSPENNDSGCWRVIWEAGPFEWAIVASLTFMMTNKWYTEPHYSFDLCFV